MLVFAVACVKIEIYNKMYRILEDACGCFKLSAVINRELNCSSLPRMSVLLGVSCHPFITPERVAELLRSFVETAKAARAEVNPQLGNMEMLSDDEFLSVLPNYCSVI